jgi:hypothetical protein
MIEAEFFDPRIGPELERRDVEVVKRTGKGPANGDEWVWLTQYCRIPVRYNRWHIKTSFVSLLTST